MTGPGWLGWVALALAGTFAAPADAAVARAAGLVRRGRLGHPGHPAHPGHPGHPASAAPTRQGPPLGVSLPGALAAGGVAVVALAVAIGPALGAAAAAVSGVAILVVRELAAGRRHAAEQHALATALGILIAELEAGGRPPAALSAAASVGGRCASLFAAAATVSAEGGDAATVLSAEPATRAVGSAWALGEVTGAPLAAVLGRVAADLAAAAEQRRAVSVALAGPRSSAVLLAGLPLLGIGLGAAMGARPLTFLTGGPAGEVVCLVGVLLDAAGVLWMRRILRRAAGS